MQDYIQQDVEPEIAGTDNTNIYDVQSSLHSILNAQQEIQKQMTEILDRVTALEKSCDRSTSNNSVSTSVTSKKLPPELSVSRPSKKNLMSDLK